MVSTCLSLLVLSPLQFPALASIFGVTSSASDGEKTPVLTIATLTILFLFK